MSGIEFKAGMKFTPVPDNGWVDMIAGNVYEIDWVADNRVRFHDESGDVRHCSFSSFARDFTIITPAYRVEAVYGAHIRVGDVLVYNSDNGSKIGPFRDMTVGNKYTVTSTSDIYISWNDDKGDACSCIHQTAGARFVQHVPIVEDVIEEIVLHPAPINRTHGTYTIRGMLEDHGVLVNTDQAEAALKVMIAYARGISN